MSWDKIKIGFAILIIVSIIIYWYRSTYVTEKQPEPVGKPESFEEGEKEYFDIDPFEAPQGAALIPVQSAPVAEDKPKDVKDKPEWNDFFDTNNSVIGKGQAVGDFKPVVEVKDSFEDAKVPPPTKVDARTQQTDGSFDPDLYDVEKLLPQEKHDDWFETIDEPISVKNRHLISVQQPIGINTVGSSKKNATLDLRPAPPNPKIVVSPWLNSTIEPDYNTRPLC